MKKNNKTNTTMLLELSELKAVNELAEDAKEKDIAFEKLLNLFQPLVFATVRRYTFNQFSTAKTEIRLNNKVMYGDGDVYCAVLNGVRNAVKCYDKSKCNFPGFLKLVLNRYMCTELGRYQKNDMCIFRKADKNNKKGNKVEKTVFASTYQKAGEDSDITIGDAQVAPESCIPENAVVDGEVIAEFRKSLKNDIDRRVLDLLLSNTGKKQDIAPKLKVSPSTVSRAISRIKERAKEEFGPFIA